MSMEGEYDRSNVFAKILRNELPSVTVFEDDDVLVLMDIFPQSTGHTLVMPKLESARNILDIGAATLKRLVVVVQQVADASRKALKPDGIVIVQASGRAAGQTVEHLHFHVIPCWEGQPLKGHGRGQLADNDDLKATAALISERMQSLAYC